MGLPPARGSGDEPGSAGEIKHAGSYTDAPGIEQIVDETLGSPCKGRHIVRCRLLPAGIFKGADGPGIESHLVLRCQSLSLSPVEAVVVYL
jgi:hypothetical protein